MDPQLSIVPAGSRKAFLDLLLLADESVLQVRDYMDRGDLYVYAHSGSPAAIALAIPCDAGIVELKAVAVQPALQSRGIGKRMLKHVLTELQRRGFKGVIVGTGNAGIGQLAYYQKAGFRMHRIEHDFFSPARGYPEWMVDNGIRLRDMVWMQLMFEA